ncbi:MAG: hypothetical protein IPP03_21590 [Dechloromonas sp.]|nr:hypothetical protein [Candidatus Dechloromonas phosphoritropha]
MDNCGTRVCGRAPFQHLVYPMPNHAGLGIHVTLDLGGQCKFGPDVSGWPAALDFSFETGLEDKFYRAIRRYYPDLPSGALQPGYTGILAKGNESDATRWRFQWAWKARRYETDKPV